MVGPRGGSPTDQEDIMILASICVDFLDAPTAATVASNSLDGTYSPSHRRKRPKGKAILSNAFFLSGSSFFFWIACWNLRMLRNDSSDIPQLSMESTIDDSISFGGFRDVSFYYIICVLAPLCFVVDAVLQLGDLPMVESGHLRQGFHEKPMLEVGVQLTFGAAAICDLMSSLVFREESPSTSHDFSIAAVHLYLVMSILMLSAKKQSWRTRSTRFSLIGDVLFLIGCVIDVSLSYYFNTRSDAIWRLVSIGKVLSSLLWLVDSVLYILASIYEEEDDNETEFEKDVEDDCISGEISLPLVVVTC